MINIFKTPEKLAGVFLSKGRKTELHIVGSFKGQVPLAELCSIIKAQLPSKSDVRFAGFKVVEDRYNSGIFFTGAGRSFPTDLLVAFEPSGRKLGDQIVYSEPSGQKRLVLPTGKFKGESVALILDGLDKIQFLPDGSDRVIQVPSLTPVSAFARQDGWYRFNEMGIPSGDPISVNGNVDPSLRFIGLPIDPEGRYTSFIGPFTRSLGRQMIGTAVEPERDCWLVVEHPA